MFMLKLLLLALSAGVILAQLPQDTLRNQLHTPTTIQQRFLADNPGAAEDRRTENAV